jgi:hypothetical protein
VGRQLDAAAFTAGRRKKKGGEKVSLTIRALNIFFVYKKHFLIKINV